MDQLNNYFPFRINNLYKYKIIKFINVFKNIISYFDFYKYFICFFFFFFHSNLYIIIIKDNII